MKIKNTLMMASGLVLLTAIILALVLKQPEKALTKPARNTLPMVTIEHLMRQTQSLNLELQASLEPQQRLMLSSDLAARIEWLAPEFVEGGFVKQGQTLLRLRRTEFELALAQAQAHVAQMRLALLEEQALSLQAKEDWQSVQGSLKKDSASELTLRKPQLALAQANFDAAKISLEQARIDLANCDLKAPFNAYINSRHVELGQYIQPSTGLGELIGTDKAQLKLPIKPHQVALLPKDLSTLDAQIVDGDKHRKLEIKHLQAGLDSRSQVYYLLAYLPDPYGLNQAQAPWFIGQFLDVVLQGISLPASFKIPAASLHENTYIYAVDWQGDMSASFEQETRVKRLKVDVVMRQGDAVFVRLEAAQKNTTLLALVSNDPGFLANDMQVRTVPEPNSKKVEALGDIEPGVQK